MPQLQNGMIVFMRDLVIPGLKLLDIEITNTFPLISLAPMTNLICHNQKILLQGYDHVAIPLDFRLHISGPKEHIFFDVTPIWNLLESAAEPFHYFTIVGLPSKYAVPLVKPSETRTRHQSAIISPFKDEKFNDSTRLFIDFFLHYLPDNSKNIRDSVCNAKYAISVRSARINNWPLFICQFAQKKKAK